VVANICSKERSNWGRLVENELPAGEADELTSHLEVCPSCREKFESICADASWWKDSSTTLRLIETESGVFRKSKIKDSDFSLANSSVTETASYAKGSPLVVISGLKPSQETGALGDLGEYTIREVIGYGGMGTVLKAWDKRLSRVVAIKVLHPHLAMNGAARVRFAREAQTVASISHPNVVPIHDVADDNSQPYIVMGFVSGGSLQDKLDRDGPLSLEESLRIGLQIAEGLEAAHSHGLVHRDIKPANILLEARWQRVLITDFGLARALDDASITASGHLAGTPQYMSPEQSRGERIDHRSDLFSLGSVLYAMLSGRPPFRAESAVAVMQMVDKERARAVHEIQDRLPFWANQLIERFHAKNPNERISTAVEASDLIRSCLQHVQNPSTGPLPRSFKVTKPEISRRVLVIFPSVLIAGALFCFAATAWNSYSTVSRSSVELVDEQATMDGIQPNEPHIQPSNPEEMDWNGSIDNELDMLMIELTELDLEFGR
jgi:eukaryotic-like serine/threonine-protein kinase